MISGGTPAFMAPELFKIGAAASIDLAALDVWSLGVTLYYMVVGRTPWTGRDEIELAANITTLPVEFPPSINDAHLKHLVRSMLDKDRDMRLKLHEIAAHDWVTSEGSDPLDCMTRAGSCDDVYGGTTSSSTAGQAAAVAWRVDEASTVNADAEKVEEDEELFRPSILVIDDSLTARSMVGRKLQQAQVWEGYVGRVT